MQTLELLSPAKNLDCGISAIDHGADAVYIGAQKYGARASAGNSLEDIKALCSHAHPYGAKVYVTVNTIIYDEELSDTLDLVRQLNDIGVDGILIQDFGLLREISTMHDISVAIHASTQTDNRTVEKVKWLRDMGLKRVVLARELSINEIKAIHEAVPDVELEVFVHGALCVSYSGQCYASQHCFGRSANRGECAQFCRIPFDLKDGDGNVIMRNSHLLSLKDMAQINNIERLADAGAVSFKIEGRLKDADYVKNVTAAYSEKLNTLCRAHPDRYRRASMGRCSYTFTPDIKKSFNRGFTTYFANGRQQGLTNFDSPKSLGEPVGKVKEVRLPKTADAQGGSFTVATTMSFSNGDGLCFFNDRRQLAGFRVNRVEGNRLFPLHLPEGLKAGTMLYRNHDQAFETLLGKPSTVRKIDVRMHLHIGSTSLSLTMTDEYGNLYLSSLPYDYQPARHYQKENIRQQLTRLGDTPFRCSDFTITSDVKEPFIPNSQLAELRRALSREAPDKRQPLSLNMDATPEECEYPAPYLYNAANESAKTFYRERGINADAFECGDGGKILMQCRYCLRHELGYCSKYTHSMPWKEPLQISFSNGEQTPHKQTDKSFILRFNCAKCQMEVI